MRLIALLSCVLLGSASPTLAQSFRVLGSVHLDKASGPPAPYATVLIPGTLFGGVTDADGRFSLGPMPQGEYSLHVLVAGYKDIVHELIVDDSDIELLLVARRADVDLEQETTPGEHSDADVREFREPGGVTDLLRREPSVEIARVGGTGGRYQLGPSTGPFANGDAWKNQSAVASRGLPLGVASSQMYRLIEPNDLTRTYKLDRSNPVSAALAFNRDQRAIEQTPIDVELDGGIHSNGRLGSASIFVEGRTGRAAYSSRISHINGGQFRSGDGAHVAAEIARTQIDADLAVRLTPFSDFLFEYQGLIDGAAYQEVAPVFLDRAVGHDGAITFRLARPDRQLEQLAVRAGFTHSLERTLVPGEEGVNYAGISATTDGADVRASGALRIASNIDGVVSTEGLFEDTDYVVGTFASDAAMSSFRRMSFRAAYDGEAEVLSGTVRGHISWQGTRFEDVPEPVRFGAVSASVQYARAVSAGVAASVGVSSQPRFPTATQLYGIAFPQLAGQYFVPVDGSTDLQTERFNALSFRVDAVKATRVVSVGVTVVDLQRYTTVNAVAGVPTMVQSEGLSVDVDARISLMRPPVATFSLGAFWSTARDRLLDQGVIGMRSPRAELIMRIQSPGGGLYFEPVVNGILGRSAVDESWEVDSGSAVWVDVIVGIKLRGSQWTIGVTNINDAAYRFHTSPLHTVTNLPLMERGRSAFVRFNRTI